MQQVHQSLLVRWYPLHLSQAMFGKARHPLLQLLLSLGIIKVNGQLGIHVPSEHIRGGVVQTRILSSQPRGVKLTAVFRPLHSHVTILFFVLSGQQWSVVGLESGITVETIETRAIIEEAVITHRRAQPYFGGLTPSAVSPQYLKTSRQCGNVRTLKGARSSEATVLYSKLRTCPRLYNKAISKMISNLYLIL